MSKEGNAQLLSSSDFIKKLPCLENIFQQDVKSQKIFLMCDSVIVFFFNALSLFILFVACLRDNDTIKIQTTLFSYLFLSFFCALLKTSSCIV